MSVEDEYEPARPATRVMHGPGGFDVHTLAVVGSTRAMVDLDLIKNGLDQTLLKHPRFSSVLVAEDKNRNNFSWKRTRVNLENHVFCPGLDPNMDDPDEFVDDFISNLAKSSMDQTKPLWELHILNVTTSYSNSTAILKVHHSMGDGVSLISLLLACTKTTSDPQSLPTLPISKKKEVIPTQNGFIKRLIFLVWTILLIMFNTLIDCMRYVATIVFLKDTESPIKRARGVGFELCSKRFVHRVVSLDDVKLVKNAMNVTVNDVVLGVTEAGLSRYLNMRYEKDREKGPRIINKTNFLPKNLRVTSTVIFNLRPSPTIADLAEMMEKKKEMKGIWGNLVGYVLLPLNIAVKDDPLAYVRRAKETMDRKKLSLEAKCSFALAKLMLKLFGTKMPAAATRAVCLNTTLTFSNVVSPQEQISFFGYPLCYIAPSVYGIPQALIIHYQSYANKLIICIGADENVIPNPHQLCDDLVKSLENIKEAVIKEGCSRTFNLTEIIYFYQRDTLYYFLERSLIP